jgi:hypothetical protein
VPFFLIFFVVPDNPCEAIPSYPTDHAKPSPLGLTIHVKPDNPRHARQSMRSLPVKPNRPCEAIPVRPDNPRQARQHPQGPEAPFQTKVNAIWEKPTFI